MRLHDKHKVWLPPGGHIELDEDPVQAALREVEEEVGLRATLLGDPADVGKEFENILPPRFLNCHRINEIHEHISLIYFATSSHRDVVQGEQEISDHIKWFTKEELDDPQYGIDSAIRYYAKAALAAAQKESPR